ncbi:glycosyl transferase [Gallaecimonas pentaromativorans]|uniref:Glucosyl-3-phosphoglycerate synthase n=1 Tax=Gallaecimonas pentaromativorans TaxID=584787 RepID=A0A3N1PQG3_9GAMM|nr:glycosyl transferase [Gallaecimonas pentaromativorans]ROQ30439.1 glucosyl-3-phosphoglycerate synthase [Gallaecimonas pentaromativorans]
MADFHQNGTIATLHNLTRRPVEDLEKELMRFRRYRPMSLVLPSLYSELQSPALAGILDELEKVPYLSEIIIGLDRANEDEYRHALKYFSRLPQFHRVLWNDGPRLREIDKLLASHDLAPKEMGKGRNVWYCLGYMLASGKGQTVALHDCDILTYERGLLARLFYPVANPVFNYNFAKGYYARCAGGKLHGRVNRLLVTPLIRSMQKVCGYSEYLNYMDGFRYSLAGEFSMRKDLVAHLHIPSDWGLEIGVLSEMFRSYATQRICQVDISDNYDHKHQDLSADDANQGLSKMSTDIAKAFFRKLATNGEIFSTEKIRTIKATYYRIALDFIDIFNDDAMINGLQYDRHKEEQAVELFAQNIVDAGTGFLANPMETPFMPSWSRVISAVPNILDDLKSAVEEDTKAYLGA